MQVTVRDREKEHAPLTAFDVCDADKVEQAKVKVVKDGKELTFCSHHYNEFRMLLLANGWKPYDVSLMG